ncbi:hypothetical protein ACHAXS_012716 [Conticribra weissflogii]
MSKIDDRNVSFDIKKSKKRQHSSLKKKTSKEELYRIESRERYDKLHHISSKLLHREAKVVKSFECQKIVRAIKAAKEASDALKVSQSFANDDRTGKSIDVTDTPPEDKKANRINEKIAKSMKRVMNLEQKLEKTKKFDLEFLVQAGLKRLGVLNLDPRGDELEEGGEIEANEFNRGWGNIGDRDGRKNKIAREERSRSNQPQSEDPFHQSLLEIILQHKRLSSVMDQLNEKVTEYRRWTMHRQDMLRGDDIPDFIKDDFMSGGKKKKKTKQDRHKQVNNTMVVAGTGGFHGVTRKNGLDGHEGTSGLFIGSLSGMPVEGKIDEDYLDDEGEEEMDIGHYGYTCPTDRKKNRPGQRARKAKALAIEAKKAGKSWDSSVNWREKKRGKNGRCVNNSNDSGVINDGKRGSRSGNEDGCKSNYSLASERDKTKHDAQKIATMGKRWKEEGQHPSWAAKTAQKSLGIVEFKGTKITFD